MESLLNDELFVIVAAIFGALSAALLEQRIEWVHAAVVLLTGSGFAIFATPAVCEWFNLTSRFALGAAHYAGGFSGNLLLTKLQEYLRKTDVMAIVVERGKSALSAITKRNGA